MLAVSSAVALADDVLRRTKTIEWVNGSPSQECGVEIREFYYAFEVVPGGADLDFPCELRGSTVDSGYVAEVEHSSDGLVQVSPVDFDADQCTVPGHSLADFKDASSVFLRFTEPATEEVWYPSGVVNNLLFQWLNHWSRDEDGDGFSDPITNSNGDILSFLPIPPMRGGVRNELAQCLQMHRNLKQVVVRKDYLLSGPVNWPELVQWGADCNTEVVDDPPPASTLANEQLSSLEVCALFHSWINWRGGRSPSDFLEGGELEYLCNPAIEPRGALALGYTGSQIAFWADRTVGKFSGFSCPAVERDAAGSVTSSTKYDSGGLREPRLGASAPSVSPIVNWRPSGQ